MEIAQEILRQLGGNRFIAMTGAKNLIAGKNSLSLRIGKNSKGVNYCKIELTSMDDYSLEFGTIRGVNYTVKSKARCYADELTDIFTENTGLYTSL